MSVLNLLASDGFITLNKSLIGMIGIEPTLLLGELASEYVYRAKTDTLTDGYFFSTIDNIENNTTLTRKQQDQAIKVLTKAGIISYKVSGMPARRYFKINEDVICMFLGNKFVPEVQTSLSHTDKQDCPVGTPNNNTLNNNTKNKNRVNNKSLSPAGKKSIKDQNLDTLTELMGGYNFSQSISAKLVEWYTYKAEQKKTITPTGMKTQLNKVNTMIATIGEDKVIYVLDESMANNYQGMIWDLANKGKSKKEGLLEGWDF